MNLLDGPFYLQYSFGVQYQALPDNDSIHQGQAFYFMNRMPFI